MLDGLIADTTRPATIANVLEAVLVLSSSSTLLPDDLFQLCESPTTRSVLHMLG